MVKMCCVKGCRSESYLDCGISFHRFPRDEKLRAKWLEAIGGQITCKHPFVCSNHFKREDYRTNTVLARLNVDAVPCLESFYEAEVDKEEETVVKTEETIAVKVEPDEYTEEEEFEVLKIEPDEFTEEEEFDIVKAEKTVVVKPEEIVVVKAEPDEFTEEEDDLLEKLEKKRPREKEATQTELKKPNLDNINVIPIEKRVDIPIENIRIRSSNSGCDKNVMVSETFMKTMLWTKNENSGRFKTPVLTEKPDLNQLTFLRFLDVKMQQLSDRKRKELRDKIIQMVLQESDLEE